VIFEKSIASAQTGPPPRRQPPTNKTKSDFMCGFLSVLRRAVSGLGLGVALMQDRPRIEQQRFRGQRMHPSSACIESIANSCRPLKRAFAVAERDRPAFRGEETGARMAPRGFERGSPAAGAAPDQHPNRMAAGRAGLPRLPDRPPMAYRLPIPIAL
jgi:hypothetical protein